MMRKLANDLDRTYRIQLVPDYRIVGYLVGYVPTTETKCQTLGIPNVRVDSPVFDESLGVEDIWVWVVNRVMKHGPVKFNSSRFERFE